MVSWVEATRVPPQAVSPPTARRTAHRFPASQTAVFPRRDRSQETIDPIIPGRAAAALPASLARILPRLWRCFLSHSLTPPLPGGCSGCVGAAPPPEPPGRARTIVEIIIPRAVRIDTIVIPCSRKRVFIRSARVLSSCRIRCRVSRIRLIWDRRASLVDEAASRRAALSSCRLRRRSAMRFLVVSSGASSSLRSSKAMCLSSSVSLARLFVCSPRIVSRARQMPRNSRWVTGGDAGPFWHSEDISRGLNSGLDLYNGLAKIFKRGCFYVRGRLAHLLVGFFLRTASSWGERLVLL